MKKLLIAATALIFSSVLSAQQTKFDDHIKFKATEHDFGKIKVGVPVTYDFAISNVSKTPVVVESATASCGCTTPVKPEQPIMGGDANKITAGFNAAAPGPFTKTITIKLAGVDEVKIITIKGEVLTEEAYAEYVKTSKASSSSKTKPANN
jgi:hypothetical protein